MEIDCRASRRRDAVRAPHDGSWQRDSVAIFGVGCAPLSKPRGWDLRPSQLRLREQALTSRAVHRTDLNLVFSIHSRPAPTGTTERRLCLVPQDRAMPSDDSRRCLRPHGLDIGSAERTVPPIPGPDRAPDSSLATSGSKGVHRHRRGHGYRSVRVVRGREQRTRQDPRARRGRLARRLRCMSHCRKQRATRQRSTVTSSWARCSGSTVSIRRPERHGPCRL